MNTIVNTVAKGLLRGVGFLANVILDSMNRGDREEENTAPAMDEMIKAAHEQVEYEQEMAAWKVNEEYYETHGRW